jgi:hypothetical protein
VVDTGETCDDGVLNNDTTPDACRTSCLPASCGDAVVDTGEECENSSLFCAACALTAPAGWLRCTDAAGNVAVFRVETWAGTHTANAFRDRCVALVEAESPVDFAYYGLGVFYDRSLWDCVLPSLAAGTSYWCGLAQDTGAADYVEPDHGWYWRGYDGTAWIDAAPFDPANGFITGDFNNAGGGPNVECTRLTSGMFGWTAGDYSCTTAAAYSGICMIRF